MKKINKMCSFYVNEWHLTVMMLPYINSKMQNNEKVTILSEENLENNIETILQKLNINNKVKNEIENLYWKSTPINMVDTMVNEVTSKDNIIIVGNEEYIENANKIIDKKIKTGEINIIDCYEVMQFNNNIDSILKNHEKVINTSGEKTIDEMFEGFSKKEVI